MTIKEIVAKYWRDFAIISFEAIRSNLPVNFITTETLTQETKDGGYDGEFILSLDNETKFHILFESKLRSNLKMDLLLKEFAKFLIIAIVRQANMIYIVTNSHFSKNTISLLMEYSEKANLEIQLLNGISVKKFILEHGNVLENINSELISFLSLRKGSFDEQTLHLRPVIGKDEIPSSSVRVLNESKKQLKRVVLIVTGNIGCGKSYYIQKLCERMKTDGKKVCLIDISRCLTYKEFFIEVLKKSTGLSFELVDLIDESAFEEAFAKMGFSNTSDDVIQMLKFVFSKKTDSPYDYSILFSELVSVYKKISDERTQKNNITFAFLNLVYAQKEVLQLLLCFLKSDSISSAILEVSSGDFWLTDLKEWNLIKQEFLNSATIQPYIVKDWTITEAKHFLKKHINNFSDDELYTLINKFGTVPEELSNLVELIEYTRLYENIPKDLIFHQIMEINSTKYSELYIRCLEYLHLTNSDILYFFTFIYLLENVQIELKGESGRLYFCGNVSGNFAGLPNLQEADICEDTNFALTFTCDKKISLLQISQELLSGDGTVIGHTYHYNENIDGNSDEGLHASITIGNTNTKTLTEEEFIAECFYKYLTEKDRYLFNYISDRVVGNYYKELEDSYKTGFDYRSWYSGK